MFIEADDPVGRALPYLRVDQQKLHAGSFSAQANRSFGMVDTRSVNIAELARAQEIANRQGLSGLGVAVTFLDAGRPYSAPSTWASQGGQGAMTSFDIRPNVVHPSMTRFIPRPDQAVIRAEYQLPPPPPPPPAPIEAVAARLPDLSPGPAPAQRLERSWEALLQLEKARNTRCQEIALKGASTPQYVPTEETREIQLQDPITLPMVAAGLVLLWFFTPSSTTGSSRRTIRAGRK